jgi:hypothetical protein
MTQFAAGEKVYSSTGLPDLATLFPDLPDHADCLASIERDLSTILSETVHSFRDRANCSLVIAFLRSEFASTEKLQTPHFPKFYHRAGADRSFRPEYRPRTTAMARDRLEQHRADYRDQIC